MTVNITFAENALNQKSWERYSDYPSLSQFLLEVVKPKYPQWPTSARIYHEYVTKDHDITPATAVAAEELSKVTGNVYVVIWPAAPAVAAQAAVMVGMFLVTTVLKKLIDVPDEKVTSRNIPAGSPNNLPGQRKNTARVLQRIPDIYGKVKATPDLIQYPYISYENNLQSETIVACIGRGEYLVDENEIFEGQTRVNQIPGASLAIYAPHTVPVEDTPQIQIGSAITDSLLNVVPIREVTGEQVLAPNNTIIWGDDDEADRHFSGDLFPPFAVRFEYVSTGVGEIRFDGSNDQRTLYQEATYFTNRLNVGDKFGLCWEGNDGGDLSDRGSVSVDKVELEMGAGGDANIPDLELLPETVDDDYYEVAGVVVSGANQVVTYTITVPASKQSEWERIALFNPDGGTGTFPAPAGTMFNRKTFIYLLNFRLGPFFCNDPEMEEVHLNFIADKGLWVDDGKRQLAYGVPHLAVDAFAVGGVEIIIELTPADENGAASGSKELHPVTMFGSSVTRDFIGTTFKVTPSFTGRFLVAVYRNTWHYWRTVPWAWKERSGDPGNNWDGQGGVFEGKLIRAHTMQYSDDIKWTHCYSISTPKYYPFVDPLTDMGDVTLVHAKTTQVKYAPQREFEKNLNMIVTRAIPFWDGDSFPSQEPTTRGLDAAFHVMRSYHIGNVPDSNIDFESVEQAFSDVFQAFGDQEAVQFNHTFDSEQASFEDILNAVGESCFVTFYRQANIIKAQADVSKDNATLLFNHRNKLPGTETRTISFATEEDYDGVEIEYSDNLDNQLKTYVAPTTIVIPRNPQKIRVAGVRTKLKAGMHAWRAANKLLYQRTVTEFDSCEEAALGIIKDKVLVADSTNSQIQDGEIIRIDGLTVYTSHEVFASGGSSYTLFIQDVDGSVQSIPVVAEDTNNSLILDGAPSGSLVIDSDAGIYPKYQLIRDQDAMGHAFQVKEIQYKNRGVYSVLATNYTEGYYFNDAIRLWLTFNEYSGFPPVLAFFDRGPYSLDFEEEGSPTTVVDEDRQIVYEAPDSNSYLLYEDFAGTFLVSYTVAAWVKLEAYSSGICRSNLGLSSFAIAFDSISEELEVTHEATTVATYAGVELDEWTHIGVTYDSLTERVDIYINGEVESTAVDVAAFDSFDGLRVFALNGRGDDFRIYNRAKSAVFMRELYQKTRFPAF